MEAVDHQKSIGYKKGCCLAEEIFRNLNKGGLYEIYKIIWKFEGREEQDLIDMAFREKYHFDFRQYI